MPGFCCYLQEEQLVGGRCFPLGTEFGERLGGSSVMNAHGATLEQGRGKLLRELSGQW